MLTAFCLKMQISHWKKHGKTKTRSRKPAGAICTKHIFIFNLDDVGKTQLNQL